MFKLENGDIAFVTFDKFQLFIEAVIRQFEANLCNQHDTDGEAYSEGEDFDEVVGEPFHNRKNYSCDKTSSTILPSKRLMMRSA